MASPIKNSDQGGKRIGQKFKSLLVWQYLLKHTDEDHAASSTAIKAHLEEYGITADRHSIACDIDTLNALFCREYNADIDDRDRLNYEIIYDAKARGYKIISRPYEFLELRLLAECINSAKFLTEHQANNLKSLIGEFCSESQSEELQNEVYLVGRVKTENQYVMQSILTIHEAIKAKQQISFKYLKHTLQDRRKQVERRRGAEYQLSPYRLLINEGNYYLLAYSSQKKEIMTFRIDRMKDVKKKKEPREGEEVFAGVDMSNYTKRVFSMFGGEQKRVRIRFVNYLLDTVVDRFGTGGEVAYSSDGDSHFVVSADVEISDQFYAWICGFRKRATIISPPEVIDGMKNFLLDIQNRYQSEEK